MTNRTPIIQLALVVAVVGLALMAGKAVGTEETNDLLLPVGVVILFITMVNPFASLIIFLLGFMRVGSYDEIGIIQIATASYTALLFLVAFARFLWRGPWDRNVVRTVTLMFLLMGYLGLSVVIAQMNHISVIDWGRGAFPLVVVCLAAVFTATVQTRQQWNVAAVVFLFLIVNLGASGAAALGGRMGAALGVPDAVSWGSTLIPAVLIAIGVAMIIEKRQFHWGYVAMVVTGLISAVLTPTRTVWISAGLTVAMLAGTFMFRHRRPGTAFAVVGFAVLIGGGTLLMWQHSGESSWKEQTARFSTLQKTSEDPSVRIREEQIREAFRVFRSSPLVGVGLGYQYQYKIAFTSKYEKPNDFNHSDLLNALAKTGLFGTLLIYGVLISAVLAAVRLQGMATTAEDRAMGLAAESSLVVALIIGNSTPMLQEKGSAFILALIIGLVLSRLNILDAERAEKAEQAGLSAEAEPEWSWRRVRELPATDT